MLSIDTYHTRNENQQCGMAQTLKLKKSQRILCELCRVRVRTRLPFLVQRSDSRPAANEDDSAAKWQGRRIQRPREASGQGNYTELDQWVITEGLGVFMGARSLP